VDPADDTALDALLARTQVELAGDRVLVNGHDVTDEIRTPEIGMLTSKLTTRPSVRAKMTPIQRSLAAAGGVVLEGRDTGSVVCPDAEVKIYLDADLTERARRRRDELAARGLREDYGSVKADMAQRDRQDMERQIAPLRKPDGAIIVDSTGMSPESVVQSISTRWSSHDAVRDPEGAGGGLDAVVVPAPRHGSGARARHGSRPHRLESPEYSRPARGREDQLRGRSSSSPRRSSSAFRSSAA
jgi:cytidylate kinase